MLSMSDTATGDGGDGGVGEVQSCGGGDAGVTTSDAASFAPPMSLSLSLFRRRAARVFPATMVVVCCAVDGLAQG